MFKYRLKKIEGVEPNASGLHIPGHGVIVNGFIESQTPIENPNLELISDPQTPTEQPSPAHMTGVVPQNQQGIPAPQSTVQPVIPSQPVQPPTAEGGNQ